MKRSIVAAIIFAFSCNYALAFEGQPKEIQFLSGPGHLEKGTLDEIRIPKLQRVKSYMESCKKCYQAFKITNDAEFHLRVDDMKYRLTEIVFKNSGLKDIASMTFVESNTGSELRLMYTADKVALSLGGTQPQSYVKVKSNY